MVKYVTKAAMEAEAPGVYEVLPAVFRDRLPADVTASSQNTMIFRNGFDVAPRLVDDLFSRLKYKDGADWPMWKLVAAFYLVEVRIGKNSVRQSGERIYSTMPWPPEVRSLADALRFTDTAYFESHNRAPRSVAGCWRVDEATASRMVLTDDTPYPCYVNEGVIAGICRAFQRQHPVYTILDPDKAKRNGGTTTRYEVVFTAA